MIKVNFFCIYVLDFFVDGGIIFPAMYFSFKIIFAFFFKFISVLNPFFSFLCIFRNKKVDSPPPSVEKYGYSHSFIVFFSLMFVFLLQLIFKLSFILISIFIAKSAVKAVLLFGIFCIELINNMLCKLKKLKQVYNGKS